jgi:hypothetical protein
MVNPSGKLRLIKDGKLNDDKCKCYECNRRYTCPHINDTADAYSSIGGFHGD